MPLRDELAEHSPPPFRNPAIDVALFVPLWTDENNVGTVILVVDKTTAEYFEKEKSLVRTLASISGVSLKKALQHAEGKEKARYEGELVAARSIQQTLIPKSKSRFPQAAVECAYLPANEVSGDYLDYFVNDAGHLVIAIGDVCGKGVPAALLMSTLRATLRVHARSQSSAAQLMLDVHKSMRDNIDLSSFISLLCCIVSDDGKTMTYARAGHLPMLQLQTGGLPPLKHMANGIALGMENDTAAFSSFLSEKSIPLQRGDRFFIYTDGIIEAVLPDDSLYSTERLKRLLSGVEPSGPDSVISTVVNAITSAAGGIKVRDDVAALFFEIH